VTLRFRDATASDIAAIAALLNATAGALTARFGEGRWSSITSERSVELSLRHGRMRVGVLGKRILTTLRLATKKPWAIDVAYFTPAQHPLYLTGMAVSVSHQRQGLGRAALQDARVVAVAWPADAIRLDAFDAPAGAGGFYERCGYEERAHVVYKDDALIYYELVLR
jgi:GNAT superfamily N-acetyltransferase